MPAHPNPLMRLGRDVMRGTLFQKKRAYFTIDDGPTCDRRHRVGALAARGVPCLWFCTGRELEQRPDDALYTIRRGGVIGNHAFSHPYFSRIPLEQCSDEIGRTDELIDKLYQQSGVPRPIKAFRFPFGDKGGSHDYFRAKPYTPAGRARMQEIQRMLRALGYAQPAFADVTYRHYREAGLRDDADWFWTFDVTEWGLFQDPPAHGMDSLQKVVARLERDAPHRWEGLNDKRSADIVLMHDHVETTGVFEQILDRLLAKGIEFQPIPVS